ncbi:protein-disulfide reductase DsbD domain-containing protein [Roseibium sp.]|uniref:protein-disulfide reductase DsbD domain-containing protein n=1 Tax=Roseibium sp. TaxID=1936156 RepID=UPI003A976CF0
MMTFQSFQHPTSALDPLSRRARCVRAIAICALLTGLALSPAARSARAASSDWHDGQGGGVRLISSGPAQADSSDKPGAAYLAGLEFSLEPGWHTYWRSPGEAGIAPQIDFSGSTNLKSVEVLYPVPERYNDGYSTTAVYHGEVVLPLRITAQDPTAPLRLQASLFFGVCKEICVPRDAGLTLDLSAQDTPDRVSNLLIARDLQRVPQKTSPAAPQLSIVVAQTSDRTDRLQIVADSTLSPDKTAATELFAVGPEGSYNGLPTLISRKNGKTVWQLSTKGLKRQADGGSQLSLVVQRGEQAWVSEHPLSPDQLAP